MKDRTEFAIVAVFAICYVAAIAAAYYLFGDNEDSLYLSLSVITLMIMGISMVLAVIFLLSGKKEAYEDKIRERLEEKRP